MANEKHTYESLCTADNKTLEEIMKQGFQPLLSDLDGWEFKGFNTLDLTSLLGFRKFKKGFYHAGALEGEPAMLNGYNVKVVQNAAIDPWIDQVKNGKPVQHAFYKAYPVKPTSKDNLYSNAILIDYGAGGNLPIDPSGMLRDYLVQVSESNKDLYLGKAYLALQPPFRKNCIFSYRIPVSFFILERHNKSPFSS